MTHTTPPATSSSGCAAPKDGLRQCVTAQVAGKEQMVDVAEPEKLFLSHA